jgi:hypothetical protein
MEFSFNTLFPKASKFLLHDTFQHEDFQQAKTLCDKEYVNYLRLFIDNVQEFMLKRASFEEMIKFSTLALEDIVSIKSGSTFTREELSVLHYMQSQVTFIPVREYVLSGKYNQSLNWLNYSFCDDLRDNHAREFENYRLFDSINKTFLIDIIDKRDICKWIGNFYYTCQKLSAYHDIVSEILVESMSFIHKSPLAYKELDDAGWAVSSIASWALENRHQSAKKLVLEIEHYTEDSKYPAEKKNSFYSVLTSHLAKKYTTKSTNYWLDLALAQDHKNFKGHQKLDFITKYIVENRASFSEDLWNQTLSEVKQLKTNINNLTSITSETDRIIENDRLFGLISHLLIWLLRVGKHELITEMLHEWYGTPSKKALPHENLIYFFPNTNDSSAYCSNSNIAYIEKDIKSTLVELHDATNNFFGVSHSIRGVPDYKFKIHEKNRIGIPNESASSELYVQAVSFFSLKDKNVREFLANQKEDMSLRCIPSNNYPLQFLLQKEIGKCWPITTSLTSRQVDSKIKNVCLWSGANSATEEIEANLITQAFKDKGISVTTFKSNDTSLDKFKAIYQSNEFEIIWVMSHGNFDHWTLGDSSIQISPSEELHINEIVNYDIPFENSRRLLVLNICDGGNHNNTGGIEKLGVAQSVSNYNQCVISNLWPVHGVSAAVYGALLALQLANGVGFFKSFCSAIQDLIESEPNNVAKLNLLGEDGEFINKRISNQNIDLESLFHIGSSVFFE